MNDAANHDETSSRDDAAPDCPHRPPCPGCPRLGAVDALDPWRDRLAPLLATTDIAIPATVRGASTHYRRRARLMIRGRTRSPKIGVFQEGTHRIADIPRCFVHHPRINDVVAAMKDVIRELDVAPYHDVAHRGVLRAIQVTVRRPDDRVQIVVVVNEHDVDIVRRLAEGLLARLGDVVHSVWFNGNTHRTNVILGPHWELVTGERDFVDRCGRIDLLSPPGAFVQANPAMFDRIIERIVTWTPPQSKVADLYCGTGAIGLNLAHRAESLLMAEMSPEACAAIRETVERGLGREAIQSTETTKATAATEHVVVREGRVEEVVPSVSNHDIVVVDPPRKGLHATFRKTLLAAPPKRLVYVACGVDAFVRDAQEFVAAGLRLTALESFDLFPHTGHVELLARFERRLEG